MEWRLPGIDNLGKFTPKEVAELVGESSPLSGPARDFLEGAVELNTKHRGLLIITEPIESARVNILGKGYRRGVIGGEAARPLEQSFEGLQVVKVTLLGDNHKSIKKLREELSTLAKNHSAKVTATGIITESTETEHQWKNKNLFGFEPQEDS